MHQRKFVVDTYGVEGKDKYVLERIFKITEGRTRTYVLKNSDNATDADITIVNVSKKEAIREWGSMHLDSNGNPSCPTLLVGANKPKNKRFRYTQLPFFATRVLKMLDEITVEDLQYTPELRIEDSTGDNLDDDDPDIVKDTAYFSKKELESIIEKGGQEPSPRKQVVLVVDDSLPVRKALDMKLTLMNYEVELASSGEQAMSLLEENSYDSVFLDVIMPGMDGYEVCKRIKRDKNKKHIPVIMLTSKSSPFDRVKGKLAGCDTYLTKPVEHDEFQKVVAGYLK